MNYPALERHSADRRTAVGRNRMARSVILPLLRETERGCDAKQTTAQLLQHGFVGVANARRGLDQGLQHGSKLCTRLTDDLQHIAGRRLVFERLLQITGALPQLSDQAHILHCDHRLRRKAFKKGNLLFGEWADFLTIRKNYTEERTVFSQCNY